MELNKYQESAVLDESNTCLVRANVGSGKTTVLIEKIKYLYEQKKIPLEDMIVLTFTNKAADEIRERLKISDMDQKAQDCLYGTFHGIALKLLQDVLPVQELGYTREFQVCLPEEELELAIRLIKEHSLKIKYKNRLRKRLDQKNRTGGSSRNNYQDDFLQLVDLLAEEKRKQNKMSYEDLLINASRLLECHKELLPNIKWIIIDEVQDCDELQFEFIRQLKKPEVNLFAVGDPNQVIYSWRGSVFNIFYRFRELYQARELSLPVNYRSSGTILAVSRRFQETGDILEGVQDKGEKISVKNHYDPFQEAEYLAEKIQKLYEEQVPYEQIAVFYRLQDQSEILEKVFAKHEIPYEVSQKKTIQDIPVLAWFLQILRFLSNHEDIESAVSVLMNKTFGEGWTEKKACAEIESVIIGNTFFSKSLLFQKMWEYQDQGKDYENLWEFLCLERYLHPASTDYAENRTYILRLLTKMKNYKNIRDFLNEFVLNGMDLETSEESKSSVKLMTLHASKGLEFDYVFIIGINDGLIPLNSKDEAAEEEERRLFYVGMTRAKKFLELSFYTSPNGTRVFPGPGRYLSYLPEKYLTGPVHQKRNPKEAAEHLQDLKKMVLEEKIRKAEATENTTKVQEEPKKNPTATEKKVEHPKYGMGVVVSENEDIVRVQFEDYGEKELLKAFSQLKYM